MKSIVIGIAIMLVITALAGLVLNTQFTQSASEAHSSPNDTVRLDN